MSHYVPVLDTPEMQRVRENQKNFSTVSETYKKSFLIAVVMEVWRTKSKVLIMSCLSLCLYVSLCIYVYVCNIIIFSTLYYMLSLD